MPGKLAQPAKGINRGGSTPRLQRATKHKQVKYTIKDLAGLKLAGHGLCGEN